MKIKIDSDFLINLIDPLQAVINPSHNIPILQCVKIESTGKKIISIGDNHEVRCKNSEKIKVDKFVIAVNFQMFLASLKAIKSQEINLEITETTLIIFHSKGKFSIPLESVESFPEPKQNNLTKKSTVNGKKLKDTLKVASRFVMNNELVPVANISIDIKKKKTTIRSTNMASLFQETIKGGGSVSSLLISGKTSNAIYNLLPDEDDLEMLYGDNLIFFKAGQMEIMAVQQSGQFPLQKFNEIISTIDDAKPIDVDFKDFVSSLKRVNTLSMKEKASTMRLEISKKELNMKVDNEVSSSSVREFLTCKFKGEALVGFNPKMLIEILSVFDESSSFSINAQNSFCIKGGKKYGLMAPFLLKK
jgi:DNA polymerase III sliding clamp (beta) subunit (PCNA family)